MIRPRCPARLAPATVVRTGPGWRPFRFTPREIVFPARVGLKGAVPTILTGYPLLSGPPSGPLLSRVVFFVVLVAALTQGWSLRVVARTLGLEASFGPEPPVPLEITSLKDRDRDIVEYTVKPAGGPRTD